MTRFNHAKTRERVLREFVRAADLGARLEVRGFRASGMDGESIRRAVVEEYRDVLAAPDYETMEEPIMAAVQRAVQEEIESPFEPVGCAWDASAPGRGALLHALPRPIF